MVSRWELIHLAKAGGILGVIALAILAVLPLQKTPAIISRMTWSITVQDVHTWVTTDCGNQESPYKSTPKPTATCQKIDHSEIVGTWTRSGEYPAPPTQPVSGPIRYHKEVTGQYVIELKSESGPLTFSGPYEFLYSPWHPGEPVYAHHSVFGLITYLSKR